MKIKHSKLTSIRTAAVALMFALTCSVGFGSRDVTLEPPCEIYLKYFEAYAIKAANYSPRDSAYKMYRSYSDFYFYLWLQNCPR